MHCAARLVIFSISDVLDFAVLELWRLQRFCCFRALAFTTTDGRRAVLYCTIVMATVSAILSLAVLLRAIASYTVM